MHATSVEPRRRALLLSAVLGLCLPALAAPPRARIWRCGNHYADQPCPAGTALSPAEAPSDRARSDADAATQRIRAQADAMARERERHEAAARGRPPAVFGHASPWAAEEEEDRKKPRSKRTSKPRLEKGRNVQLDGFTARGAAAGKKNLTR